MKKIKKIIVIGCIAIMACMMMNVSVFAYSDCNHEAVEALTNLEVLSGYDDGTFKPEGLITRAELAKIITVISGGEDFNSTPSHENPFSDIDNNHWAFDYILYCAGSRFVDGYEDGTFKPNENVSFAEAVKVCLTVTGYSSLVTVQTENWYEPWIDLAYQYKIIDSKDKDPNSKATRVEVAELISKTINLPLCMTTGYELRDGVFVPTTEFADGTVIENGVKKPFMSLLTEYFK